MTVRLLVMICGLKSVVGVHEGFIVGGDYVDSVTRFPHVAVLSITRHDDSEATCGSSILNQQILITVAHCFDDVIKVRIYVGNSDRRKGILHRINRYYQHKDWNPRKVINDIALARLKKPLSFGQTVKRIIVMRKPPKMKIAEVAGWGVTDEDYYSESHLLKHTKQKLWTLKECREILPRAPTGTICGGEKKAKNNFASHGDSGSGLIINKNILIGMVSYKVMEVSRSLVVYTHAPSYYDWIVKESRRLSCQN
ncbi:granzyme B(G,H)-like [Leguminivora glycinivorella]|uniref:granzyme B(G,H)-like n=1 Tax=Leguminivora glycinivorella TaxID=1035111 RepID=UPI00200DF859|nr:granzyme B(G,H)-like [Leguminivora glycinivorella]